MMHPVLKLLVKEKFHHLSLEKYRGGNVRRELGQSLEALYKRHRWLQLTAVSTLNVALSLAGAFGSLSVCTGLLFGVCAVAGVGRVYRLNRNAGRLSREFLADLDRVTAEINAPSVGLALPTHEAFERMSNVGSDHEEMIKAVGRVLVRQSALLRTYQALEEVTFFRATAPENPLAKRRDAFFEAACRLGYADRGGLRLAEARADELLTRRIGLNISGHQSTFREAAGEETGGEMGIAPGIPDLHIARGA